MLVSWIKLFLTKLFNTPYAINELTKIKSYYIDFVPPIKV